MKITNYVVITCFSIFSFLSLVPCAEATGSRIISHINKKETYKKVQISSDSCTGRLATNRRSYDFVLQDCTKAGDNAQKEVDYAKDFLDSIGRSVVYEDDNIVTVITYGYLDTVKGAFENKKCNLYVKKNGSVNHVLVNAVIIEKYGEDKVTLRQWVDGLKRIFYTDDAIEMKRISICEFAGMLK